jgi:hypothetical protein
MENLIVNEVKFFAFETNLREKVAEDELRIKLTEYMLKNQQMHIYFIYYEFIH